MLKLALIWFFVVLTFSLSFSQTDGWLDSTFGVSGMSINNFGFRDKAIISAIQPDGKIIVVGISPSSLSAVIIIARYNTDGLLDSTFGNMGKVSTSAGSFTWTEANSITLQPDGKILLAGSYSWYTTQWSGYALLIRYNSDGSLDNTFGTNGMLVINVPGSGEDIAHFVALQSDGKIITYCSGTGYAGCFCPFLMRCNADGSIDSTFDGDGKKNGMVISSLAVQQDDKLITFFNSEITRINTNGSYDSTFGINGILSISTPGKHLLNVQDDGKIFLANLFQDTVRTVRLNTDGSFDNSFDSDGIFKVRAANPGFGTINTFKIQRDGKVIIAGTDSVTSTYANFAIARYDTDGSLDSTFHFDGIVRTPVGNGQGFLTTLSSILLQDDDKIIAIGHGAYYQGTEDFVLVRYLSSASFPENCNHINSPLINCSVVTGRIVSELNEPISGAGVALSGNTTDTVFTTGDGQYSFSCVEGTTYTITPFKNNDSTVANGITTFDILLLRKHILGIQSLSSPYKIIAADVDGSSTVTTLDILLIRAMILGNIATFPGNKLWDFVPSDYVFPNPSNPIPFKSFRYYEHITEHSNQDFIGIKLGDVNNSWDSTEP